MFPSCSQVRFHQHLSYLPNIIGSETQVGPQRFRRLGMDIQRCKGTMLTEAIDARISILKRCNRADSQMTTVEVITTTDKRAELRPFGAAVGHSTQRGAAGAIVLVDPINCSVQIDPMIEPGSVDAPSTAIDIDISARFQACPGMSVFSHCPDGEVIGDAVIDPDAESTSRKVVTVCFRIGVDIDKVAKARHPHPQAVSR